MSVTGGDGMNDEPILSPGPILDADEVQLCRETHACNALCDSHEALRGQLEEAERERDEARDEAGMWETTTQMVAKQRDEVKARAAMADDYRSVITVQASQLADADVALADMSQRAQRAESDLAQIRAMRLGAENERLRETLSTLRRWDMLSLDKDGHGVATADAPWAVALIDAALAGVSEAPPEREAEFNGRDCPYWQHRENGTLPPDGWSCGECVHEPACITDEPTEGWPVSEARGEPEAPQ